MKPQTFTIKFKKEVSPSTIKNIWESLRKELETKGYHVENIRMPKIKAFIQKPQHFFKTAREFEGSPHLTDKSEEEWGEQVKPQMVSALCFFSDVEDSWTILKRKGGHSLQTDLRHKLKHIWESVLGLEWGSLSKQDCV